MQEPFFENEGDRIPGIESQEQDSEDETPKGACTCDYPEIVTKNLSGHHPTCPTHGRVLKGYTGRGT